MLYNFLLSLYHRNEEFDVIRIFSSNDRKADVDGVGDQLSDILDQYGYKTETSEHTEQLVIHEI